MSARPSRIALIALVAVLGLACKTPDAPSSFGVDLTVTLDAGSQAGLAQVILQVSGAESYEAGIPASGFPSGSGHVHYLPGAHAGALQFSATAVDAAGAKLGAGSVGPVALVDGQAVPATLAITVGGSTGLDGGGGDGSSSGKALGTTCGLDSECGSGHCTDGVCCTQTMCPACMNCGGDGQCSAPVFNKDDNTPNACNGASSCDGTAQCKMRWTPIATFSTMSIGDFGAAAAVGNLIFFSPVNANTYSFDVTGSATTATMEGANGDICGCGGIGYMFPAAGKIFYLGQKLTAIDPTSASPRTWTTQGYPAGITDFNGEFGVAAVGNIIYATGGNDSGMQSNPALRQFDTSTDAWSTGTVAPFAMSEAAGGSANGLFYVFGGSARAGTSQVMLSYSPTTTMWTMLASPPTNTSIRQLFVPTWQNKLVAAQFSSLLTYEIATNTWDTAPIPLPTGMQNPIAFTAGANADLYIIGDTSSGLQIFKYAL